MKIFRTDLNPKKVTLFLLCYPTGDQWKKSVTFLGFRSERIERQEQADIIRRVSLGIE